MSGYGTFARYYDCLTKIAQFTERADYFARIFSDNSIESGVLLDVACGSGSLSFLMEKKGFDVVGVDVSEDMLQRAIVKKQAEKSNVLFLKQDARNLDLFGTIRACICSLDSVNHFETIDDVKTVFQRIGLFTEKGGVFIFDVNTLYKHKNILGNNAFNYETENGDFIAWQNYYNDEDSSVDICLDFFSPCRDGRYDRYTEDFTEYYYSPQQLEAALNDAGFELSDIFGDLSFETPSQDEQRLVFVCKKIREDNKVG